MSEQATLDTVEDSDSRVGEDSPNIDVYTSMDKTSVGEIPEDWKAKRLEDITGETLYGASESAEDFNPDKPRYLRVTDLGEKRNQLKDKEPKSISKEKVEKYILKEGDMLFARSGSVGKTFYYDGSGDEHAYGGYLIKFPLNKDEVNPHYLQSYTHSPLYWNWVERITRTGAQPNINAREYSSILIPLPPKQEQEKIASVLYNVDRAIQKADEIIKQTQRVKKGLREDLFTEGYYEHDTEKIFLGPMEVEKPKEWSLRRFKDFSNKIQDGPHITPDYVEDGIPFVSSQNVNPFKEGFDYDQYQKFVSKETYEEINKNCRPEKGDLIISRRATIGPTQLIRKDEDFAFFVGVAVIKTDESVHNPYLEQLLNWEIIEKLWHLKSPGSTMKTLNLGTIKNQRIPLPPLKEQKQIAETLRKIDGRKDRYEKEKELLQRIKKGLMQDLLTGEVRTDDKDIEVLEEVEV